MNIVSLIKLSLVDYPDKLSCVLFTQGCNFICPFCHNKDLVLPGPALPSLSHEEIFDFLKARTGKLDAVVITGGEPTLDKDLIPFIKEVKELGYLVKLDSNGTNPSVLKELLDNHLVDYVAMDIKNSPEKYAQTIGLSKIDLAPIKKSISLLIGSDIDYEFRMTTIEEFHSLTDMDAIGELVKGAKHFYFQKYVDSPNCVIGGYHEVEGKKIREFALILSKYVEDVNLRGY
ncbi:MAG: anaerobic ribonucleoside-triphosphate reductase activating protein [Coprobacillus sp.]|nr:anaerobic ribonucleoside-triphosphate reductase activating protein [Coprobacillus sp.]